MFIKEKNNNNQNVVNGIYFQEMHLSIYGYESTVKKSISCRILARYTRTWFLLTESKTRVIVSHPVVNFPSLLVGRIKF